MSADELRRRALKTLEEARDQSVAYTLNTRFRPSTMGQTYVPAMTAEEIAFQVTEGNALTRAYTYAIEAINEAYRTMYESEERKKPEQEKMETY